MPTVQLQARYTPGRTLQAYHSRFIVSGDVPDLPTYRRTEQNPVLTSVDEESGIATLVWFYDEVPSPINGAVAIPPAPEDLITMSETEETDGNSLYTADDVVVEPGETYLLVDVTVVEPELVVGWAIGTQVVSGVLTFRTKRVTHDNAFTLAARAAAEPHERHERLDNTTVIRTGYSAADGVSFDSLFSVPAEV